MSGSNTFFERSLHGVGSCRAQAQPAGDTHLKRKEGYSIPGQRVRGEFCRFLAYCDYGSAMTYSLNQARGGIVASLGTLLSERAISLEGHRGLEMNISTKRPDRIESLVRLRIYDVDRRVYVLQFIIPRSEDNSVSADKANSISILLRSRRKGSDQFQSIVVDGPATSQYNHGASW